MKKLMTTTLVLSALAFYGTALAAAPLNDIVQPRPATNGYQTVVKDTTSQLATTPVWIASSDVKAYYLAPKDITAAYPNAALDDYRLSVREVPTSYYVRDVLIPAREQAKLSVDGYQDYAYSVATYHVRVERKAGVSGEVITAGWTQQNTEYSVSKIAQKDYTADGRLIGEQSFTDELKVAAPGTDEYALARGIDQKMYRFRPAGR